MEQGLIKGEDDSMVIRFVWLRKGTHRGKVIVSSFLSLLKEAIPKLGIGKILNVNDEQKWISRANERRV